MNSKIYFEWDEEKNHINTEKHGIAFSIAVRIFGNPCFIYESPRKTEMRHVAVGEVEQVIIAVAYTVRHEKIRIISTRKARKKEKDAYRAVLARHVALSH
ncbi:MAG: BrnT family toxin [Rickettsiales bacterium]|nr:BrnT family toxin [Rickettsiales bacterium]